MNNSSFVGVHRLKRGFLTCFESLESKLSAEYFKCLFSFFTVVSDIDGNSVITLVNVVGNKSCKVLQSVKSFASVTDDISNIFTVKSDDSTVFIFFGSNFYFAQVHVFQYFFKICLCGLNGSNLIKCPNFRRASAKQSENFLFGLTENFKLSFFHVRSQFKTSLLLCLINGICCYCNFTQHKFFPPIFFFPDSRSLIYWTLIFSFGFVFSDIPVYLLQPLFQPLSERAAHSPARQ